MESTQNHRFPTTHWTLVGLIQNGSKEEALHALEEICKSYWYPVYAFLRRSGHNPQEAEDLTQNFFAKLLTDQTLNAAQKTKGKLRTFLLSVLTQMKINEHRHLSAAKRGSGIPNLSLDCPDAERRYESDLTETDDPANLYLRAWARDVFRTSREKLRAAFQKEGREAIFEDLLPYLGDTDSDALPYADLARKLSATEGSVRVLIHRVRTKFRNQLERDVARTVLDESEIEEEMEWLRMMLSQ